MLERKSASASGFVSEPIRFFGDLILATSLNIGFLCPMLIPISLSLSFGHFLRLSMSLTSAESFSAMSESPMLARKSLRSVEIVFYSPSVM